MIFFSFFFLDAFISSNLHNKRYHKVFLRVFMRLSIILGQALSCFAADPSEEALAVVTGKRNRDLEECEFDVPRMNPVAGLRSGSEREYLPVDIGYEAILDAFVAERSKDGLCIIENISELFGQFLKECEKHGLGFFSISLFQRILIGKGCKIERRPQRRYSGSDKLSVKQIYEEFPDLSKPALFLKAFNANLKINVNAFDRWITEFRNESVTPIHLKQVPSKRLFNKRSRSRAADGPLTREHVRILAEMIRENTTQGCCSIQDYSKFYGDFLAKCEEKRLELYSSPPVQIFLNKNNCRAVEAPAGGPHKKKEKLELERIFNHEPDLTYAELFLKAHQAQLGIKVKTFEYWITQFWKVHRNLPEEARLKEIDSGEQMIMPLDAKGSTENHLLTDSSEALWESPESSDDVLQSLSTPLARAEANTGSRVELDCRRGSFTENAVEDSTSCQETGPSDISNDQKQYSSSTWEILI